MNVNGKSDNVTTIFPPLFHVTSCTLPFLRVSKLFHVCRVCSHTKKIKSAPKQFPLSHVRVDEVSCLQSLKFCTFRQKKAAKTLVDSCHGFIETQTDVSPRKAKAVRFTRFKVKRERARLRMPFHVNTVLNLFIASLAGERRMIAVIST